MMRLLLVLIIICSIIPVSGQTYKWTSFTKGDYPLPSDSLRSLEICADNILWIGSDSGLTGYNGSVWISYNNAINNLASDEVSSIQINSGTIWLGTNNGISSGQINTIDDITWELPYRTDNSELINNKINSINVDSLGTHWFCTDSGVTVITDTNWESLSTSSNFFLSKNIVLCINQQPTRMQYLGTENGGVSRFYYGVDGVTGASTIQKQWTGFCYPDSPYTFQPGLLSDTVKVTMVANNGDPWFGTQHGVSTHIGPSHMEDSLKNPYSWRSYTTDIGLIDNNVRTLAQDSQGHIWIGTSNGVSRLTPADTSWLNFTTDSGLVNNDVKDIVIDGNVIWFATSGGLSKLTIELSSISDKINQIARSFEVHPAYPNPFNMSTTIEFNLVSPSDIQVKIFDINGRLVKNLLNTQLMSGNFRVSWDGRNNAGSYISSGVYFAAISTPNQKSLLKLVLVK